MKLPRLFEDKMKQLLGEEYGDYEKCFEDPHYGGLRVNTMKISPEEFERICPFHLERIPWVKNGYFYDINQQPARHPYYYGGLYYIQEPSAMTPASLLPIEEGDKVLDICAAPGGKSTELGARLKGTGILVSNDISNSRAKALLKNVEIFGIRNSVVVSESPNKLGTYFPEYFDKILIDAPCSGEGMFRKSPTMIKNWEEYGVDYYNGLQKDIIISAAEMLKPGGYMLYSTCTFSPEENEATITYLLEQYPEFTVVDPYPDKQTQIAEGITYDGFDTGKPQWIDHGVEELKHCIRLWPHKIKGEGHFIALLHKRVTEEALSNGESKHNSNIKGKSLLSEEALEFLKLLPFDMEDIVVKEDRVYHLPKGLPDLKGLRILRHGLLLGEMKKQRFEPSQALASALYANEYEKVIHLSVEDPNVIRYLKCESIELEDSYEDGWYLICVENHPLGWCKMVKTNIKNKYSAGWRWV